MLEGGLDRGSTSYNVLMFRNGWNRIFTMSLFVEHMLLGDEEAEINLKPLVLDHMRVLGQVSVD